jgi:hypothetical protein
MEVPAQAELQLHKCSPAQAKLHKCSPAQAKLHFTSVAPNGSTPLTQTSGDTLLKWLLQLTTLNSF